MAFSATHRRTGPGAAASSLSAGGGKRSAVASTWAALATDSDSESETDAMAATVTAFRAAAARLAPSTPAKKAPAPVRVAPGAPVKPPARTVLPREPAYAGDSPTAFLLEDDPVLVALNRGDRAWGDILWDGGPVVAMIPMTPPPPRPASTEDDLWTQPWAARLDIYRSDTYDTRALSDAEWEAMLTWLYASGWDVRDYDRDGVEAYEDDLPPRVWCRPLGEDPEEPVRGLHGKFRGIAEADHHHHDCCCDHHHAPAATKTLADRKATIPRFCREGAACEKMDCCYVHADTIPRINEPCRFGAECGSSDPTGLKRSQCLRMHPGETWDATMVIHRPVVAAPAPAPAAE